jgi:hypothetical protein
MPSDVRTAALERTRIDTHSHMGGTIGDLREQAAAYAQFPTAREQTDSRITAEGCRVLYGIDPGTYLRPDCDAAIFDAAAELHASGFLDATLSVMDRCGITTQLAFCQLRPEDSALFGLTPRIRLIAYIDSAICGEDRKFCPDGRDPDFCYYDSLCYHFRELLSLEDYLGAIDATIDHWRQAGVVAMKTALAYTLGLRFGDPSRREAGTAFDRKGDMDPREVRVVQDYAFRHALLACGRNGLPVVVHTGFPIWGHGDLAQTNPVHLHSILADPRYRDITFVLLHGGNPYVGETTYMVGMFPNVILDFTWISWMTRTRFRSALAEWLEIVPHDRICWGSDCGSLETAAGIDQVTRHEIAGVLEDLIARRILGEPAALAFLQACYQDTPARVFGV